MVERDEHETDEWPGEVAGDSLRLAIGRLILNRRRATIPCAWSSLIS
jgi:hypothetical protein